MSSFLFWMKFFCRRKRIVIRNFGAYNFPSVFLISAYNFLNVPDTSVMFVQSQKQKQKYKYFIKPIKDPCQRRIQGGRRTPPLPKIGKNKIFWRKIVIFHTKYPKNVRASLRSAQFLSVRPPILISWIRLCLRVYNFIQ